ncbi:hypothetical protein VOLCADRAFT_98891 [Volvox carteri f. nagariensis]|uniref:Uncharacterized protein n=1 Tax=Volvox carteri f. nagariensis TaxID=3068 RepID=D8UGJ0_VOLCA|nr:uncharacterized protein VOLCADRAFT_98891 [Volvox carteri f. nagariensis]EFJ41209.1 hypothetical protein VOLCADRAFT_98891 [Volvox carteri f. nagariensis]|eukprot:XP_002957777.1 hypothetical protein VOLCADRAFT_98891 [Volvox carteri f. nagariensis]
MPGHAPQTALCQAMPPNHIMPGHAPQTALCQAMSPEPHHARPCPPITSCQAMPPSRIVPGHAPKSHCARQNPKPHCARPPQAPTASAQALQQRGRGGSLDSSAGAVGKLSAAAAAAAPAVRPLADFAFIRSAPKRRVSAGRTGTLVNTPSAPTGPMGRCRPSVFVQPADEEAAPTDAEEALLDGNGPTPPLLHRRAATPELENKRGGSTGASRSHQPHRRGRPYFYNARLRWVDGWVGDVGVGVVRLGHQPVRPSGTERALLMMDPAEVGPECRVDWLPGLGAYESSGLPAPARRGRPYFYNARLRVDWLPGLGAYESSGLPAPARRGRPYFYNARLRWSVLQDQSVALHSGDNH